MGSGSFDYPAALGNLFADFERTHDPERLLSARSDLVDQVVTEAFAHQFRDAAPSPYAVVAVGGYGRRELFPYSDIDFVLLLEKEGNVLPIKKSLSGVLQVLWDSELQISHSVRTVAECSRLDERNIELQVSLLDLRFVEGDIALFHRLLSRLSDAHRQNATTLSERLGELARLRHQKFNNTPYHLEPNVKESPGGIRDIHLLRWLAQISPGQEFFPELLGQLEAPSEEAAAANSQSPKHFLFTLRTFLHLSNKRDTNLLTFELQDESSRLLPPTPIPPEEWMRFYFQHARRIFQLATRALDHTEQNKKPSFFRALLEWKSKSSSGDFAVSRDRIVMLAPHRTLSSSDELFRLFAFVGQTGCPLAWETQRSILGELNRLATIFQEQRPQWNSWIAILSQPHAAIALREMQGTGILPLALPVWQKIDSLVVRDFYHRYTVDEHTLVAIQSIDNLLVDSSEEFRRFHELALEEDKLGVLRFALLLHDLGKGLTPGDHVNGSLEAARAITHRIHAPEEARKILFFLIEHHLDLSLVMNGRDLNDPSTARLLTSRIDTSENLRALTLFTFADISAVNLTTMTLWRTEQLWRVFRLGMEQLTRELDSERIHPSSPAAPGTYLSPALNAFLDGFPKRYLKTHSTAEIHHHRELAEASRRAGAAVEIRGEAGAYLITVLAHDKPGLFASLSGVLSSFGMNIVKGEAYSNSAGYILDLIRFTDPLRTLALNPEEIGGLQQTVEKVVTGAIDVRDLLKKRRLGPKRVFEDTRGTSIRFDNGASDYATLLEYSSEDRPGLLYELGSAITDLGCNIEVVLIDTEAFRASDVFYITKRWRKLTNDEIGSLRSRLERVESGDE